MKYGIGLALGVGAAIGARHLHLPRSWRTRGRAAWNCVQGKPTVYGVSLVAPPPPPLLNFAPGTEHAFVADSRLNTNGVAVNQSA